MAWGLARISSRELTEWYVRYQREPFGELRQDLRMAILTAAVANTVRAKDQKAFQPEDFLLKSDWESPEDKAAQTVAQQVAIVEMWNAALGGRDLRQGARKGNDDPGQPTGENRG